MAAAVGQAMGADQAARRGNSPCNAQHAAVLDVQPGCVQPCFNADVAADLLDSRWEAITQAYGCPARRALLPAQPVASAPSCLAGQQQQPAGVASAVEAAVGDAAGSVHAAQPSHQQLGRGISAHAQQQSRQHSKPHSGSSKPGSSSAWRARQR
jgi:hypothetical protein